MKHCASWDTRGVNVYINRRKIFFFSIYILIYMYKKMLFNGITNIQCLIFITFCGLRLTSSQKTIPEYLRECYENSTFHGPRLPMNFQILIDIVRRAEKYSETSINVRTMSASLLHRFKFDGIEYYSGMKINEGVLPFGGTGNQRSKNRIIEELVPGNPEAFPSEALTVLERCTLHWALSNTVWEHTEASRDKLCIEGVTEKLNDRSMPGEIKMCPLEFGVVLTPFGTIAPGSVISAIAASLQPQNVTVKLLLDESSLEPAELNKNVDNLNNEEDEVDLIVPKNQMALDRSMWLKIIQKSTNQIDSVWLATVAGDLAEMAVYQGPVEGKRMTLGATGFWNSSMRPNIFYLVGRDGTFDATRAELIGGIDGLIIAKKLPGWLKKFQSLRLSQILDMYYSDEGSIFDSTSRACDRGKVFWQIASRSLMEEQTYATSQILAYRNSVAYTSEEALKGMVRFSVETFNSYTKNHLFTELHCNEDEKVHPRIEALVAFDGAWSQHYTADFLSVMADDFDVSFYGSKIGLIHGTTGDWMLNVTESPARLHYILANINNYTWPSMMNFEKVLPRISTYLDAHWRENHQKHIIGNLGQAIILLAPRTNFDAVEQQKILKLLKDIKIKHPDVHFLYWVSKNNSQSFKPFLLTEEDHLIQSFNVNDLTRILLKVPRILRPPKCDRKIVKSPRNQIEDYVGPGKSVLYRLNPRWRRNTKEITVTFHNVGYGTIEICKWNQRINDAEQPDFYCKRLSGHSETLITDRGNCDDNNICNTTHYEIKGLSSKRQCAEIDCKTPEHIRYIVRIENFYCSGSSPDFISISTVFSILLILLTS